MGAKVRWSERGYEVTMSGVVTAEEARRVHAGFSSDPRSDRVRYQLFDLREVEEIQIPLFDVEAIAAADAVQTMSTPSVRLAVVRKDDRFDAQLKAYARRMKGTSWKLRLFTDETEARSWAKGFD